jgi:hypothetical protein
MDEAVEALYRAERDMERGFTEVAIAYALISLAHSALSEEQRSEYQEAIEKEPFASRRVV